MSMEEAVVPVLAALATGLPVMFGALRHVPRIVGLLERAVAAWERIAERLDGAELVRLAPTAPRRTEDADPWPRDDDPTDAPDPPPRLRVRVSRADRDRELLDALTAGAGRR